MLELQHLKVVGGSRAYGFDTPESDKDYRGVCWQGTLSHLMGFSAFEQSNPEGDLDIHYESLRKFCFLVGCKSSFTHLDTLWAPTDCVIESDIWGDRLRAMRRLSLAVEPMSRAIHGFCKGQAHSVEKWFQSGIHTERKLFKAQHHTLRTLWQLWFCLEHGDWPVRVREYDARQADFLMQVKQTGLARLEWEDHFREATELAGLAELRTSIPLKPDTAIWEDIVIEYHIWLARELCEDYARESGYDTTPPTP
jgi:predicted nucleotidyltransferase